MIGQSAGKDYAYLLGVYLGDGCITTTGYSDTRQHFRLNTIDADFAEATAAAIKALTGRTANIVCHPVKMKNAKDNYAISITIYGLADTMVADTKNKTEIPAYVFDWDLELRKQFIIGLMDSEGFVGANHKERATNRSYYMGFKSCDLWVPEFIRLLQVSGLRIGKVQTEKPRREGYKPPTRFTIKMQSWVDAGYRFNIARKQSRVDAWASEDAYTNRSRYPRRSTSETICKTAV